MSNMDDHSRIAAKLRIAEIGKLIVAIDAAMDASDDRLNAAAVLSRATLVGERASLQVSIGNTLDAP